MIIGAKYWNRDYYSQENNPIDVYNKKAYRELKNIFRKKVKDNEVLKMIVKTIDSYGSLESCGATALVNCCTAVSPVELQIRFKNNESIQIEQAVWDWLNDPRHYNEFLKVRNNITLKQLKESIIPSRIPQYLAYAAEKCLGVKASFRWNVGIHKYSRIVAELKNGNAIQIQRKSPWHYLAIVAYDTDKNELIYHDSWPSRFANKKGKAKRMTEKEFNKVADDFIIIYYKE